MCYNISLLSSGNLELRYAARFPSIGDSSPSYYINAFDMPQHPVIANDDTEQFHIMHWGLIPFWVKNPFDAEKIRTKTMNARAETLFEKPSFRQAIIKRRCLIPADGFFEWRNYLGRNYPYYIRLKNQEIFSLAGIWERWTNKESKEIVETFSVITCDANPLMQKVHNKKKRMPVILNKEDEMDYLHDDLSKNEIEEFLVPYPDELMEVYTISR
ncbi:MAG: SOS response-associated peptidase, partial [Candidatus Heimdallarchaeota archaeon]|nr:SOS response-associated peptidase [Candidatus Heimdallarchaeota archaeon]